MYFDRGQRESLEEIGDDSVSFFRFLIEVDKR